MINKKINVIDLFAGAGGLTYGFIKNGFDVVETVEFWDPAVQTYNLNFNKNVIKKDITNEDVKLEIEKKWKNKINMVIGGFPCQGFSLAGKRSQSDERNQLYNHTIEIISNTLPEVFLLENVKGILSYKEVDGVNVIEKIKNKLEKIGYYCDFILVDATKFGVPQKRERVIFIGAKKENKDKVLKAIKEISEFNVKKIKTVRDAIFDLEDKNENFLPNHIFTKHSDEMIKKIKNTKNGFSAMKGYSDAFRKLYYDKPSYTVKENHGGVHCHPTKNRVLTPRELARLQTFPDDFVFCSTKSNILKQIGNAVPPLLSYELAKIIRKVFYGK